MKKVLSIIGMLAIAFTLSFGVGSGTAAAQSCSVTPNSFFDDDASDGQTGIEVTVARDGCSSVTATLEVFVNGEDRSEPTTVIPDETTKKFYIPLEYGDEYDYTLTVTTTTSSGSQSQSIGGAGIF